MKIPHLTRDGSFRPQMRQAVRQLRSDAAVSVTLRPAGGYRGEFHITVSSATEQEFEAEIALSDWTRFPARIRAAATELRDQGLKGRFKVGHDDGVLNIQTA